MIDRAGASTMPVNCAVCRVALISDPGRFPMGPLLFLSSASFQGVDLPHKGADEDDDKAGHALGGAATTAIGWFRIRFTVIGILHK